MSAPGFRSVFMVASCAAAALSCTRIGAMSSIPSLQEIPAA